MNTIPSYALTMGEIWETKAFEWVLPVHNASDREVTSERVNTTCDWTKNLLASLTLTPHETRDVRLTVVFTLRKTGSAPPDRDFGMSIRPQVANVDQSSQPEPWTLTARGPDAFRLHSRQ